MDYRELSQDYQEAIRVLIHRELSTVWTALPAMATKWNYPNTQKNTVELVSGVLGRKMQNDGKWIDAPMPPFLDVPVHYMGASGMIFTHPIADGDEGIVIFSARSIDGWHQNGGQQPIPEYARIAKHDLSDGMFIPGMNSLKKQVPNIHTQNPQWRNRDGTLFVEMDGDKFRMTAPGGHFINGAQITADGDFITKKGVSLDNHVHINAGGSGDSGPPKT